jgi:hypothetical protein
VSSIFVGKIADVWSIVAETERCHDVEVEVVEIVEIFASVDTLARAPQERGRRQLLVGLRACMRTHA